MSEEENLEKVKSSCEIILFIRERCHGPLREAIRLEQAIIFYMAPVHDA